jgi:hypothetical protein
MTQADRVHSTPPTNTSAPDPVVELGHAMMRLWWAHRGAEACAWKTQKGSGSRVVAETFPPEIYNWLTSLEKVASYTIATSLEGALIRLALAADRVDSIDGADDEVARIKPLMKSAGDAIVDALGHRFQPIQSLVTTYTS